MQLALVSQLWHNLIAASSGGSLLFHSLQVYWLLAFQAESRPYFRRDSSETQNSPANSPPTAVFPLSKGSNGEAHDGNTVGTVRSSSLMQESSSKNGEAEQPSLSCLHGSNSRLCSPAVVFPHRSNVEWSESGKLLPAFQLLPSSCSSG